MGGLLVFYFFAFMIYYGEVDNCGKTIVVIGGFSILAYLIAFFSYQAIKDAKYEEENEGKIEKKKIYYWSIPFFILLMIFSLMQFYKQQSFDEKIIEEKNKQQRNIRNAINYVETHCDGTVEELNVIYNLKKYLENVDE